MTQRKRYQGVVLLLTVVFSAVLLWALTAVVWPAPAVYAGDPPEILTITVTSSKGTYFYDPGLGGEGGTVYFNSVGGEGAGQVLTVTVTCSGTVDSFEGAPAFDDTPPPDYSAPWEITYTVEMSAETQSGIVFTATNASGTDTAVITFTQDNIDPGLPALPQARPDSYTDAGEYDDDTLIYFTWNAASDNTGGSGIETYRAEIENPTPQEDAGTDFEDTDTGSEGLNTYYVAAVDHVGNVSSAVSDTITIDLTPPSITGITVTSNMPTYFYDPGLAVTGGEVFFNSLDGEGGGQTITVTVSFSDDNPYSLTGDSAFGDPPGSDTSGPPWTLTYTIETGANSEPGRVFTVTDQAGNTDTAVINFIQDNVTPTVEFTDVTNPSYDSFGDELDTDGSNWYDPDHLSAGWYFTSTVTDTLSGLALANASWDHANDAYDQLTYDPGLDGDGVFNGVSDDGDGMVTVTLTITDHVGNSASDTVVLNLDNTDPTIISPTITEGSVYLYADSLTVYYGDDMGMASQAFTVQGDAQDNIGGVGLRYVSYSAALNQGYSEDFVHLGNWYRDYTANRNNTTSGVITATIYDWVGNFATQTFTYTRDIISPTIVPTAISETSPYLYANGLTLYYSDRMGGSAQDFEVQGTASDDGAGFRWVTFTQAFGDTPGPDSSSPWSGHYDVINSNNGSGNITVTAYDNVGNWSTGVFTYIEDTTNPTVSLTDVTDPGYDSGGDELDADGSNWYNAGDFIGTNWTFTSTTSDGGAGLFSGSAFWDHSANQTDRTLNCGPGGDGTFSNVSGDANGTVTVTVTITDNVGNPASDTVVFNIDNTAPTITSPYISESSNYLYADDLTIYYGAEMGSPQTFTVNGHSDDGGVGLGSVAFSPALGDNPYNQGPLSDWWGEYSAASSNTDSGTITVTVSDQLGNAAYQTFDYFRDAEPPMVDVDCPALSSQPSWSVSWSGWEPPPASGVNHYDVQYKVESGAWQDWHTNTLLTQDTFGPTSPVPVQDNTTYYFRVRAEDNVSNEQQTNGEDATTYHSGIKKVFLPLIMANPNWGFETGDFTGWQHGGQLAQSVQAAPHSGSYAALLGSPSYPCNGVPVGSAWLRRSVTVPSSGSPTLSFWYRVYTQDRNSTLSDQYDLFAVYINGNQVVKDANTTANYGCSTPNDLGWKPANVSLSAYKGQTIEITFYNYNRPDGWYNTYTYVDDVSVQ